MTSNVRICKKENRSNLGKSSFGEFQYKTNSDTDFPPLPTVSDPAQTEKKAAVDFSCSQNLNQLAVQSKKSKEHSKSEQNESVVRAKTNTISTPKKTQSKKGDYSSRQTEIFNSKKVANNNTSLEKIVNSESGSANADAQQKCGRRKRTKKKKCQPVGKISLVTPEMHCLMSGEKPECHSGSACVVNINSTEEYPELSHVENEPFFTNAKSNVEVTEPKRKGKLKYTNIAAISGSITQSTSSYRNTNGWISTRSFSDILKATTVPASSLKFKRMENKMEAKECNEPASSLKSSSTQKEEISKDGKISGTTIPCQSIKKEALSSKKSKTLDDKKASKKSARTHFNLSDFFAVMNNSSNGKIKKRKEKFNTIEKKITSSTLKPHNMLDSTAPLRKRGKERELPKSKQLSTLKKIILKERQLKKLKAFHVPDLQEQPIENPSVDASLDEIALCPLTDDCRNLQNYSDVNLKKESVDLTAANLVGSNAQTQENNKAFSIAKQLLHRRKFREYCDQLISEDIDNLISSLLNELVRFQDRLYQKDPAKAKTKKRMVCGLKEVTKHLKMKKVKVLVITPDVERIHSEGGLDDMLTALLKLATEYNIPCVFGLNRKKVGSILKKKVPVSCVGIFNYEGTEEIYRQLMDKVSEARTIYSKYFQNLCELLKPELISRISEPMTEKEKQELWSRITNETTNKLDFESFNSKVLKEE